MDHLIVEVDDAKEMVRVFNRGTLNMADVLKMVKQARAIAHKKSYNLLYDLKEAEFKVSVIDLYSLPRDKEIYNDIKSRVIKSANVFSFDVDKDLLDFMQTTALNAGINWRSFHSIENALEWLDPTGSINSLNIEVMTV